MSTKIIRFTVILLLVTVAFSACKKDWLDVNYDATLLSDDNAPPYLLVPNILAGANPAPPTGSLALCISAWMGYWCVPYETGMPAETYQITPSFAANDGDIGPVLAEANAKRNKMDFYQGMMKVVRVNMFAHLVDELGNIPYFQAYQANISQPAYDNGKDIYADLMKQLDSAQTLIKNADVAKNIRISEADIIFHGDKEAWARFINTLKLRLLIHQANVSSQAGYIKAEIAKITAEGSGFLQSGEDAAANPGYNTQPLLRNQYYNQYCLYGLKPVQWQKASANIVMLDILKRNKDPRLGFFYTPALLPVPGDGAEPFPQTDSAAFRGNKLGLPLNADQYPYQGGVYVAIVGQVTQDGPVSSGSGGILKGYDMSNWIITSTESMFLQAEAIYRGWLSGNAEDAYKNAVKESFRWLNVGGNTYDPDKSFDAFGNWYAQQVTANNPEVSWAAAPDKYKLIVFQKYISFNGIDFFEAWTDYRRNGGYPQITLSLDPARKSDKLPIHLFYSPNEYVTNTANVQKEGTVDPFNTKIWWMP